MLLGATATALAKYMMLKRTTKKGSELAAACEIGAAVCRKNAIGATESIVMAIAAKSAYQIISITREWLGGVTLSAFLPLVQTIGQAAPVMANRRTQMG
jgi:hypothetical protein